MSTAWAGRWTLLDEGERALVVSLCEGTSNTGVFGRASIAGVARGASLCSELVAAVPAATGVKTVGLAAGKAAGAATGAVETAGVETAPAGFDDAG